jgi:O-methyltransferase involved in polyketide biosynthesis
MDEDMNEGMDEDMSENTGGGARDKVPVELEGVPETLLWNLYQRSVEAGRPGRRVLDDPRSVELVERIDYPFERFGGDGMSQWHALRVACLDGEVRRFLAAHPGGTVVALGEGLETQFWRVDDGLVHWLTVDLPETVALRDRLLPEDPPRRRTVACSALDLRWMDELDAGTQPQDVLVTAQGLLMYLPPREVRRLIAACAERFPGGSFLFDALPRAMVARNQAGAMDTAGGYRAPRWQWGMDTKEYPKVATASPRIAEVRSLPLPRGRGLYAIAPISHRLPVVRSMRMSIVAVRFGPADYRNDARA